MKAKNFAHFAAAGIALATLPTLSLHAGEMPASFAGKTITILVAAGAGGAYGLHARLLAQYLGGHLAGSPGVVTQFMPGAAGVKAANYLYNAMPHDGTALGMLTTSVLVSQALKDSAVKFDAAKMNWIGRIADTLGVIALWHTAPAKSIDDARRLETVVGSTGRSGNTYLVPALMNTVLGTKFKIVVGYRGTAEMDLAMERGEIHGRNGTWSSFKATRAAWLKEGKIRLLAQIATTKAPDLPNVPLLADFARSAAEREVLEFVSMQYDVGFSVSAPPGLSAAPVTALRRALEQSARDPALLADAEKMKVFVNYESGDRIAALVRRIVTAPQTVIDQTRAAEK